MPRLNTHFDQPLTPSWRTSEIGQGKVMPSPGLLRLRLLPSPTNTYHDAQIADYHSRRDFCWKPPVTMTVRAKFEHAPTTPLTGTAGFGFWNHPYVPGERGFRLPQTVWFFFSSPPSDMRLAKGVAGPGWKAAVMDAARWPFLALAPTAPIGFVLMRIPALYDRLWPIGQRALGVSERMLDPALLNDWHTYILDWRTNGVAFSIDGLMVHEAPTPPRGPLGFVAWIDNQYAIVTPQGHFGFGLVAVLGEQALVIETIHIESL
jgi:hypothetical protein